MQYPFLSRFRTSELKKIPQALVLGGLLAIGSSLSTLTPVMAAGIQNLASFDRNNGALPNASLTLGTDGLFYGTTVSGGSSNNGTIFSFNPNGDTLTSLASFDGANGSRPFASLTLGTDGLFYGTTLRGGSSGFGTIFSFNPTGNTLTSLASFDFYNGSRPYASLTLGADGLFYGTASGGGSSRSGTIFSFNPTGNTLTSLASFDFYNGAAPVASLTLGADGLFYGTTAGGGSSLAGTIFSFNPTGNTLTSLASFDRTNGNGAEPVASLTLGTDGLFYGTTSVVDRFTFNAGTIFSFNPTGNTLTSLARFDGTNGGLPYASLTLGTDGLFYGTTSFGGNSDNGTLFSFNPTGNILTSLASFDRTNGDEPQASLTLGTDGLFYGTTTGGGSSNNGTIFSFDAGFAPPSTPVPEPSSLLGLLTLGTLGTTATFKRKLKK